MSAVGFYVTALRGQRVGWLAGPFPFKSEAEAHIPAARIVACLLDPWCDFDAFGVTRLQGQKLPPGVLHKLIGF